LTKRQQSALMYTMSNPQLVPGGSAATINALSNAPNQ
jgi:hypothetical protein